MTTSQDMMNEFKRQQQLKEYRERQKQEQQSRFNPMNAMAKINSLRNNINKVGSGLSSLGMKASQSNMPKMASLGVGAQNLGNKLQSFGNTSNAASNVSNVANTANTVGNAGQAAGTLSNAAGALGKAGGAVGAVAGGASAANNFAKGDYVNGGLDTAKTVASFMGPWGMAAAAAINMYQKMQSKQKAKQMKEMQKSQEQMSKTEQANEESLAGLQDTFQNDSEQAAQNMTLPESPTFDSMKTQLPLDKEISYQVEKNMSPFANDSGYDYDLRGAYERQGTLNPEGDNGHLSDYDKLPIHPTFSNESKYYNGQDYAVDPNTHTYLPNTKEEMMDAIRNGLGTSSSASGSPTGFASDINTPDETQTLQNDQSGVPQIEDANGNVSAFPTTREAFAKSLTDNGWTEDVVNSALQGLNGGNKDMADYISAYNNNASDDQKIAIPQTNEEIELARNGQFYQPQGNTQDNSAQLKESLLERIKNGLGDFKAGYEDNSMNGFANGDLANKLANSSQPTTPQNGVLTGGAAQTKKTLMNRIGEAAGTGRRLMANPWTQAAIAGLVSKAAGGDIDDMAIAAYKYGTNKAKADDYYRKMNPDAKVMPVFNNYTADDYKAKAYNDYNQGRTMISRRDLFKLNNPNMSDEDIDKMLQQTGINGDEMISLKGYDSVQKANYNNGRLEQGQQKIDNQKEYQQGQLKVSQSRAAETARHDRVSEGQRGQSIANAKANSDRNYNLKVNQQNVKNAEEELKSRGYKKVNGKWVKQ